MKIALALALVAAGALHAAEGYDAFKLVRTRPIFDPSRTASHGESKKETKPKGETKPNFLALTGTMVTESRTLAFFTGSKPEHSKVIAVGAEIANFRVKRIAAAEVEIERDGKPVVLTIGKQIPLEGSVIVTAAEPAPVPESPAPSADAKPPTGDATTPTTDKAEIIRRMMERRKKESSK